MINKIHLYDKVISPVITEKSTNLTELNKITFKINKNANKKNIKKSIEKIFKVNVIKVNIVNLKTKIKLKQGKLSKKSGYKKAIVTLKKGQSIDLTTGI